jgi:hypothetical protein
VTAAVIELAGGSLSICGQTLTSEATTDDPSTPALDAVDDASSALEALCIRVEGDRRLVLARELTILALNCVASGFGPECQGAGGSLAELFASCNAVCASDSAAVGSCLASLAAVSSRCEEGDLPALALLGNADSCSDPGPAGSSKACSAARKTRCTILAPGRGSCREP